MDPAPREIDPLGAFLESRRTPVLPIRATKRFNAGEHAWLAGRGAEHACAELKRARGLEVAPELFTSIRRKQGHDELTYGELVALSGDLYESPEQLFEERPALVPWLWGSNDLSELREVFAEELTWIETRLRGGPLTPYPDKTIRLAWTAKSYVELALRNTDHFGWHNMLAYCRHHTEALRLACEAEGRMGETFRRALYTNAFADHFLTDGFAAGHIRVPRAEIIDWAAKRDLNGLIAGSLSKLLHDQDGHVDVESLHGAADENTRPPDDGLLVRDATGATWTTRCDGQLFLEATAGQSLTVERATLAVSASVLELLVAWKTRELPPDVYQATRFVPFPHPDAPTLSQKFGDNVSESQLEELRRGVAWYAKTPWLSKLETHHISDLFQALPDLMSEFRSRVARDIETVPNVCARIDPGYLRGYRTIA